jgi:hypothetical protein
MVEDMRTLSGPFLLTLTTLTSYAQAPSTADSFHDAVKSFRPHRNYTFGTAEPRAIRDLDALAAAFDPYGIAGHTVINHEWQRYQPFNPHNFVFKPRTLELTATLPPDGGVSEGGINSGQIWSKETFQPGVTGAAAYAFEIRMKIPYGHGMWPAFWLYSKPSDKRSDASEIDHPEFFVMKYQNQFDWTGSTHGPGVGEEFYAIDGITRPWGLWHPGIDFSAAYHDYQTLWTQDAVYKYVDGTLITARYFKWTSANPAQFGANLAVGSSDPSLVGLQPDSPDEFPSSLSIIHIRVWAKK